MPNSLDTLLIAVIAILPGVPADSLFRRLRGVDWREKEWQSVLRLLLLSLAGLLLYSALAHFLPLPGPIHVIPQNFRPEVFNAQTLYWFVVPYLGHVMCAIVVAGVAGQAMRWCGVGNPNAWEQFVGSKVPKHWVLVALTGGAAYVGTVDTVDVSVEPSGRDVLLCNPGVYDPEKNNYVALPYAALFLPASLISSVASLYSADHDGEPMFSPGDLMFPKEGA